MRGSRTWRAMHDRQGAIRRAKAGIDARTEWLQGRNEDRAAKLIREATTEIATPDQEVERFEGRQDALMHASLHGWRESVDS